MRTKPKSDNPVHFEITNKTKGKVLPLPFAQIKEAVLGEAYDLSLVFVGDATSRRLNRIYRNKDKPTNVLSFPLSKKEGEIFINLKKARTEAPDFEMPFKRFVAYLYIHGLLHLKGLDHGKKMEQLESKFLKRFGF
jgi:rRNA maturation RNase YbeY